MHFLRFVWVLLLLFSVSPLGARAEGLILGRAVFEDPTRELTLSQVQNRAFVAMEDMLSQGYSKSAFWIRLEVAPPPEGGAVRLRIVPTMLDEIRLFEPDPERHSVWHQQVSGDTYPFESSGRSLYSLGFIVQPAHPYSTYYLRIVSTSSILADLQALQLAESNRRDAIFAVGQMVYLAFMGFVLLWAIRSYRQRPERVTGFFIAYQLLSIFISSVFMGTLSPFWVSEHPRMVNDVSNLLLMLNGFLAAMFHHQFLTLQAAPRRLLLFLTLVGVVFPFLALSYVAGLESEVTHLNALAHLTLGVLLIALGLTLKPKDALSLRAIRATYLLLGFVLSLQMLNALGWLGVHHLMLRLTPLFFLLSAGLMLHLLSRRAEHLAAVAARKLKEGEMAMQQLTLEKQYAAEQERFTAMLTHELKTPIGVALVSIGAIKSDSPYLGRIRQALSSMNDIVDRSRLVELVRNKRLPVNMALVNVSERVYECIEASSAPERVNAVVGFELETRTDSHLIGIIVANLIDNALKYSPADTPIELSLARTSAPNQPGLLMSVTNRIGVAGTPDPALVFSKYYRSPGAHNKTGSGLGLHLCQHLASLIGAHLSHSKADDRVEFDLWLPN